VIVLVFGQPSKERKEEDAREVGERRGEEGGEEPITGLILVLI
jgi:hypothetical protein